jgi:hypothetical protein
LRLLVWLLIGLVFYFTYGRHHSRVQQMEGASAPSKAMAD